MAAARGRAWLVYLAAGVVSAAAYLVLPRHSLLALVIDSVGGFFCSAAVVAGVRQHAPARRLPWYLFAAASACWGVGDVLWTVYDDVLHVSPFPSPADIVYLAAYPLFAAGLVLLLRGRASRRDDAGVFDASIIACGLGLLSWTFLMRPIAADETLTTLGRAVSLAYPVGDVLLLAMLTRLMTSPGARGRSYQLLALGLGLMLTADVAYAVLTALDRYDGGLTDAGFILSYTCVGAAALHPSMRGLSELAPAAPPRVTFQRFALLGLTTLIAPGVLLEEGVTSPAAIDWPGITVGSLLLFLLILARVWSLVRRVQDQATRLDAIAHRDALTGAANRRTWDLVLPDAMARAAATGDGLVVAVLDLDHFKRYNDLLGHQAGDRLLVEATAHWSTLLRRGDVLARYGGEEFCLLMTGCTAGETVATLERLRAVTPEGQTFSAGVAVWDGTETADELVGRADRALYEAKHAGRDRFVVAQGPVAPAGGRRQPTAPRSYSTTTGA